MIAERRAYLKKRVQERAQIYAVEDENRRLRAKLARLESLHETHEKLVFGCQECIYRAYGRRVP